MRPQGQTTSLCSSPRLDLTLSMSEQAMKKPIQQGQYQDISILLRRLVQGRGTRRRPWHRGRRFRSGYRCATDPSLVRRSTLQRHNPGSRAGRLGLLAGPKYRTITEAGPKVRPRPRPNSQGNPESVRNHDVQLLSEPPGVSHPAAPHTHTMAMGTFATLGSHSCSRVPRGESCLLAHVTDSRVLGPVGLRPIPSCRQPPGGFSPLWDRPCDLARPDIYWACRPPGYCGSWIPSSLRKRGHDGTNLKTWCSLSVSATSQARIFSSQWPCRYPSGVSSRC